MSVTALPLDPGAQARALLHHLLSRPATSSARTGPAAL